MYDLYIQHAWFAVTGIKHLRVLPWSDVEDWLERAQKSVLQVFAGEANQPYMAQKGLQTYFDMAGVFNHDGM